MGKRVRRSSSLHQSQPRTRRSDVYTCAFHPALNELLDWPIFELSRTSIALARPTLARQAFQPHPSFRVPSTPLISDDDGDTTQGLTTIRLNLPTGVGKIPTSQKISQLSAQPAEMSHARTWPFMQTLNPRSRLLPFTPQVLLQSPIQGSLPGTIVSNNPAAQGKCLSRSGTSSAHESTRLVATTIAASVRLARASHSSRLEMWCSPTPSGFGMPVNPNKFLPSTRRRIPCLHVCIRLLTSCRTTERPNFPPVVADP